MFEKLATVQRPTYGQGNNLGITLSNSNAYTNVPVSVQPASSSVQEFYGQRQIAVTDTIFTYQQLTLKRGDVFVVGSVSYQVQGWRDLSGAGRVLAVDCIEYRG